jgi:predicted ATP-dependent endonuclease of OLD family
MEKDINESMFLKGVYLSGYKSIHDVNIDLQKGLNIIIGKNSAGKTNFLKFLSKILSFDYKELNNFSARLLFQNGNEISLETTRNIEIAELFEKTNLNSKIDTILKINNKIIKGKKDNETAINDKLIENNIIFDNTFLCHGVPKDYLIVDKPFQCKIEKKKVSNEVFNVFDNQNNPYFIRSLALDIVLEMFDFDNFKVNEIKKRFDNLQSNISKLKTTLKKYSPVQDIRFSENYNIFIDEQNESFTLNNIFLEFKVDDNWLPYSNLSDGTKRLFYIISEVYEEQTTNLRPSNSGKYYTPSQKKINRFVLIEEPELGIHPHQFHKLMEFLKEESEQKQILLTTHSPQALDSLNENEFNRIIIAYSNNSKEGTKLRHLNEVELFKAKEYIKEDFLSDYWLYSDLEK